MRDRHCQHTAGLIFSYPKTEVKDCLTSLEVTCGQPANFLCRYCLTRHGLPLHICSFSNSSRCWVSSNTLSTIPLPSEFEPAAHPVVRVQSSMLETTWSEDRNTIDIIKKITLWSNYPLKLKCKLIVASRPFCQKIEVEDHPPLRTWYFISTKIPCHCLISRLKCLL